MAEKPLATRSCAGLTVPSPPRSCACASRAVRPRPASLNSPCSASLREPYARPIFRRGDNLVILADGKNKILYTTDGSEPKAGSSVYSQGAKFSESGVVKARCQFANGKLGPVSQAKFGISKTGWKVKSTTSGNAAGRH